MAVENATDRAVFVHADDFGESVTYTPSGGAASTISALIDRPHGESRIGDLGVVQVGYTARVRDDDVAAPANGDTLATATESFIVRNARQDLGGTLWTLDLELQ